MKKALFISAVCLISSVYPVPALPTIFGSAAAGNWSDISHWATTSGGVITHPQVPTANDDVYFDTNSFDGPQPTGDHQ